MTARIIITFAASALADLEEVLRYFREQEAPAAGERRVAKVMEEIELLAGQPDMGRVVPEFELSYLRELIRPPFRIVYRREEGRVRIVRIWRSERLLVLP